MSERDKKIDQIINTIEKNDVKFLKLELSDIHGNTDSNYIYHNYIFEKYYKYILFL